jgi:hypothetical protein
MTLASLLREVRRMRVMAYWGGDNGEPARWRKPRRQCGPGWRHETEADSRPQKVRPLDRAAGAWILEKENPDR